jgi:hypothetical protein
LGAVSIAGNVEVAIRGGGDEDRVVEGRRGGEEGEIEALGNG